LEAKILFFVNSSFPVRSKKQIAVKPRQYCLKPLSDGPQPQNTYSISFFCVLQSQVLMRLDILNYFVALSVMFLPTFTYCTYMSPHKATIISTLTVRSDF